MMIKTLLRVIGVLLIVGALVAAWYGFEALDNIQGQEMSIFVLGSEHEHFFSGGAKQSPPTQQQKKEKKKAEDGSKKAEDGSKKEGGKKQKGPRQRQESELVTQIEDARRQIDKQRTASYVWFGTALAALVVGVGLVFLPSSRKRKRKAPAAELAPVPAEPAPLVDQPPPAGQ